MGIAVRAYHRAVPVTIREVLYRFRMEAKEWGRDMAGVGAAFYLQRRWPDAFSPASLNAAHKLLLPHHQRYVTTVSLPYQAVSLELAALLLSLCRSTRPAVIADLGSGFSSFVFRTYAAEAKGGVTV